MIISEDAGASWLWTCEQPETSFGYLYGVGRAAARSLLLRCRPIAGLAFSDDGSCTWQRSGGALSSLVASDFFVDRDATRPRRRHRGAVDSVTGDIGPPAVFAVDRRRHDLRRDAALHRAGGREHRQPGDRAQQSRW